MATLTKSTLAIYCSIKLPHFFLKRLSFVCTPKEKKEEIKLMQARIECRWGRGNWDRDRDCDDKACRKAKTAERRRSGWTMPQLAGMSPWKRTVAWKRSVGVTPGHAVQQLLPLKIYGKRARPALINARVLRASSRCHQHRSTGVNCRRIIASRCCRPSWALSSSLSLSLCTRPIFHSSHVAAYVIFTATQFRHLHKFFCHAKVDQFQRPKRCLFFCACVSGCLKF